MDTNVSLNARAARAVAKAAGLRLGKPQVPYKTGNLVRVTYPLGGGRTLDADAYWNDGSAGLFVFIHRVGEGGRLVREEAWRVDNNGEARRE